MKRLIVAACLAVGIHVALLSIRPQWTPPAIMMPQSRSVSISLVAAPQAPAKKAAPQPITPPKPKPKPKPVAAPQPEPEPVPEPDLSPEVQPDEPEQQMLEEMSDQEDQADQTPGQQEGAVITSSVPRYDINPRPVYPPVAIRRRYEGTVLLEVLVSREGRAQEAKVVQSSGYTILDRRALTTVEKWVFVPAMRGAEPVETWVEVPVVFELK